MDEPDSRSSDPPWGWSGVSNQVQRRAHTEKNSHSEDLRPISSGKVPGMDEQGPADATDSGHHENACQDEEARPQACRETSKNSFVHETHAVPQPPGPKDVFASLLYEIKSALDTAFREAWQVTVEFFVAEVYNSIPAQREHLSPQKARYTKMNQAERKLLTAFSRRHASR